jgi:excisionase family DNA binding protein
LTAPAVSRWRSFATLCDAGYPQHLECHLQATATPSGAAQALSGAANVHPNRRPVGGARVTSQRLTVQEAAEVLNTSVDAVRMRVRRGSLESEKDSDGRVYVWVDEDSSETKPRLDGEPSALISAKDETIRVLTEQLEAERRANEENRRIVAALTSRIPDLEAPASPEPPGGSHEEGSERPRDTAEFPVRGSLTRPWWRRVLG